jgi:hypothetical protein
MWPGEERGYRRHSPYAGDELRAISAWLKERGKMKPTGKTFFVSEQRKPLHRLDRQLALAKIQRRRFPPPCSLIPTCATERKCAPATFRPGSRCPAPMCPTFPELGGFCITPRKGSIQNYAARVEFKFRSWSVKSKVNAISIFERAIQLRRSWPIAA